MSIVLLAFIAVSEGARTSATDDIALHGHWNIVGMVFRGVIQDTKDLAGGTVTIENGEFHLHYKEWSRPSDEKIVVRPSRTPKEIDFYLNNRLLCIGIYEQKNGILRIIHSNEPKGPRPTGFDAEKNEHVTLYILKKAGR
jgi:uncharacterized protein (TIGR03067 family)